MPLSDDGKEQDTFDVTPELDDSSGTWCVWCPLCGMGVVTFTWAGSVTVICDHINETHAEPIRWVTTCSTYFP